MKKIVLNSLSNFFPMVILSILKFIFVRFLIFSYGNDINSMYQLSIQILGYLYLLEGGLGMASAFSLYKPLKDEDYKKISQITKYTDKTYKKISLVALFISLIMAFIFPNTIETNSSYGYLSKTIFFIVIAFTIILEYLHGSAKIIFNADQNNYVVNSIVNVCKILICIVQLVLMYYKLNIYIVLAVGTLSGYLPNKILHTIRKRKYKFLENYQEAKKIEEISKNSNYILFHNLVGLVYSNTSYLIISKLLGSFSLTVYSSYNLIVNTLIQYFTAMIYPLFSYFGNMKIRLDNPDYYKLLRKTIIYVSFFAVTFSIIFYFTVNPFIEFWIGKEYELPKLSVLLFSLYIFYSINIGIIGVFINSIGLYKETLPSSIAGALLNIILSIVFVEKYGIMGIIISILLSQLLTLGWVHPKVLFVSIDKKYWRKYIKLILKILILYILIFVSVQIIKVNYKNIFFTFVYYISSITGVVILFFILFFIEVREILTVIRRKSYEVFSKKNF